MPQHASDLNGLNPQLFTTGINPELGSRTVRSTGMPIQYILQAILRGTNLGRWFRH